MNPKSRPGNVTGSVRKWDQNGKTAESCGVKHQERPVEVFALTATQITAANFQLETELWSIPDLHLQRKAGFIPEQTLPLFTFNRPQLFQCLWPGFQTWIFRFLFSFHTHFDPLLTVPVFRNRLFTFCLLCLATRCYFLLLPSLCCLHEIQRRVSPPFSCCPTATPLCLSLLRQTVMPSKYFGILWFYGHEMLFILRIFFSL